MSEEGVAPRRVKYYGIHDMATGWQIPRVAELTERFDPENVPTNIEDILQLHNVQQYLEQGLFS
ncbi:hypothetical protein JEG46_08415, partial [Anoxybacillus sp. LAT_26]|nr:hypothetical protein [Anoxybacillus sp. LAT_26]